jgi:hypothetical protein
VAWGNYWQRQLDGVEAVEKLAASVWTAALAAILAAEFFLKNRIARGAQALPLTPSGHFRTTERREFVLFRAAVERDVATTVARLRRELGGLPPTGDAPPRTPPPTGFGPVALRDALPIFDAADLAAERIRRRDEAAAPAPAPAPAPANPPANAPAAPAGAPAAAPARDDAAPPLGADTEPFETRGPFDAPVEEARPDPVVDQPAARAARARDDLKDATDDQLMNLVRDFCDEVGRVLEEVIRLTGRFGTLDDVLDYALGPKDLRDAPFTPEAPPGWRLGRGRARLSLVAHVRGLHRRRTLAEATARGISEFRLDLPKEFLGRVRPAGIVGPHLWRVRSLGEWQDIAARENAGRIRSSAFDSLGLGFGDPSYVVPVPALYRADAVATGAALRERFLAARRAA